MRVGRYDLGATNPELRRATHPAGAYAERAAKAFGITHRLGEGSRSKRSLRVRARPERALRQLSAMPPYEIVLRRDGHIPLREGLEPSRRPERRALLAAACPLRQRSTAPALAWYKSGEDERVPGRGPRAARRGRRVAAGAGAPVPGGRGGRTAARRRRARAGPRARAPDRGRGRRRARGGGGAAGRPLRGTIAAGAGADRLRGGVRRRCSLPRLRAAAAGERGALPGLRDAARVAPSSARTGAPQPSSVAPSPAGRRSA